jgi:hypothetical protein
VQELKQRLEKNATTRRKLTADNEALKKQNADKEHAFAKLKEELAKVEAKLADLKKKSSQPPKTTSTPTTESPVPRSPSTSQEKKEGDDDDEEEEDDDDDHENIDEDFGSEGDGLYYFIRETDEVDYDDRGVLSQFCSKRHNCKGKVWDDCYGLLRLPLDDFPVYGKKSKKAGQHKKTCKQCIAK